MIINTTKPYNSNILELNIKSLLNQYPFLKYKIIGKSVIGKPIYSLILGNGKKNIFYSFSMHANEWIVSLLAMKFIENFCIAYANNTKIYNSFAKDIFHNATIHIVPLVNPDGVDLVTNNLETSSSEYINAKLIAKKYSGITFPSGWKSNINGVDLNLQFPAGWENAKKIKYSQGYTSPAPRDFVGFNPLSQPEALAIYKYTLENNFDLILAYHTQGKEIYWQFQNYASPESYTLGIQLANISGYTLANVPYISSFAGYKDWFLQQYHKPAFTIEAGLGENPLPLSQFNQIYNDNIGLLIFCSL